MYPISRSSAYDRAITMFSPDGRLYQVEYASKILEKVALGFGVVYKEGVLLAGDKSITSSLIKPDSIEKLFKIDDHVGAVSAGIVGDARRLVQMAREEAQENRMYYEEPIHIETLVKRISSIKQMFTQFGGGRPFGVAFIIGGVDETGPRVFETEPSGALAEYTAVAIGKNKDKVLQLFEKQYRDGMDREEAIKLVLNGLKAGLEKDEKFIPKNIDFAFIEEKTGFQKIPVSLIESIVKKMK